jgi:Na+-transporting methylmalonyl-CoA/oxaloacetate decarboxylase gamma subunit
MENLSLAANLIFVGLVVVFSALIILAIAISAFKLFDFFGKKSSSKETNSFRINDNLGVQTINNSDNDLSNDELIAVISAAVASVMGSRPESKIKVRSIRRLPQVSPIWNTTGKVEQILSKL